MINTSSTLSLIAGIILILFSAFLNLSDILSALFIFAGGFIFLSRGSDFFVESAARISRTLGVSDFVIGLTIIAVGTSLPELLTGIASSLTENPGIIEGTVIGSNIVNITLILGLTSIFSLILIKKDIFYRDCYILIGISFIFYWFTFDGAITNIEGLILILFFIFYVGFLFRFKPHMSVFYNFEEYLDFVYRFDTLVDIATYRRILKKGLDFNTHKRLVKAGMDIGWKLGTIPIILAVKGLDKHTYVSLVDFYEERLKKGLLGDSIIFFVSCFLIYLGAKYFVEGAVRIADILNVDQAIVGLTVVSIGTSLPELVISIKSVRKGFSNMVLGNVIGSNIANITIVMGTSALLVPIRIMDVNRLYVIPFMIFITFLLLAFIRSGWHIRKIEGIVFLIFYLGFLAGMIGIAR